MPSYKTKAIVLGRKNTGEFDRLITFYTEKLGKITVKATGVRKIQSKLAGHLEPFFYIDMIVASGRVFDKLTSARIIDSNIQIRKNIDSIKAASYLVNLVNRLVKEHQRDLFIFNLLRKSLVFLSSQKIKGQLLSHIFAWKIIAHLGYKPELNSCLKCHKKITDNHSFFSIKRGGIICQSCQQADKEAFPISYQNIIIMRQLLNQKLEELTKLKIDNKSATVIYKIIEHFVSYQMEKFLPI